MEGAQAHHHQQTVAGGRQHQGHRHQVQVEAEQHLSKMEAEIVGINAAGKVDFVPATVDKETPVAEEVGGETPQSVEVRSSTTMEDIIVFRSAVVVVDLHHPHLQVQAEVAEAGTRKLTT